MHNFGQGAIKNIIVNYTEALPDKKQIEDNILETWNTTNEANNATAKFPFGVRVYLKKIIQ